GILKNGLDQDGEAVALFQAPTAKPMERPGMQRPHLVVAATRALDHAIRPAAPLQIRLAGIVGRERRVELAEGHLLRELGLVHRTDPLSERYIGASSVS